MALREAAMSGPVTAWLEGQGLTVYAEVPFHGSSVDHVGATPDFSRVVMVEMKTCLTRKVLHQAYTHQLATHEVYCIVASAPSPASLADARKAKLGVGRVHDGKVHIVLHQRRDRRVRWEPTAKRLIDRLRHLEPGGVGGTPCLKGEGPAQECYRQVRRYRREHPDATWKQVFDAVPNHYAHARSFMMSMAKLEQFGRVPAEDAGAQELQRGGV
jgi:hypothetical protein